MKIRPMRAELLRADGRTDEHDMMNIIVAFRNFVNAPKNGRTITHIRLYRFNVTMYEHVYCLDSGEPQQTT